MIQQNSRLAPTSNQEPTIGFFDKMVNNAFDAVGKLATWENAASAIELASSFLLTPIDLRNRSAEIYRITNAIEALKRANVDG